VGIVVWVLWQISYAFQQCTNFENQLDFDKVTESSKVGTFFETHPVEMVSRHVAGQSQHLW